tara:strand:- start:1777 stop:2676 length:900 start_codon:yes stop_codon:yes gene_type:complete
MSSFCSPNTTTVYCYDLNDLKKITTIYNKTHSTPISITKKSTSKSLYNNLNKHLKNTLGDRSHFLWADYLIQFFNDDDQEAITLKEIADKRLMPKKPAEWSKNPRTWLSNFDIDKVLLHYHKTPLYNYHFIGVVPVDFGIKDSNGSCSYDERCSIDMEKIIKRKKKYMGLVSNLDNHDGPGYHWTSLFFIIDPKLSNYGIYYYDSVASGIPPLMKVYIADVQRQLKKIYGKQPKLFISRKKHQRKNTECGMFSIWYQIRWLNLLMTYNDQITFKEIIDVDIDDDLVAKYRDILYRPSVI